MRGCKPPPAASPSRPALAPRPTHAAPAPPSAVFLLYRKFLMFLLTNDFIKGKGRGAGVSGEACFGRSCQIELRRCIMRFSPLLALLVLAPQVAGQRLDKFRGHSRRLPGGTLTEGDDPLPAAHNTKVEAASNAATNEGTLLGTLPPPEHRCSKLVPGDPDPEAGAGNDKCSSVRVRFCRGLASVHHLLSPHTATRPPTPMLLLGRPPRSMAN